jgi:hypothetical protein
MEDEEKGHLCNLQTTFCTSSGGGKSQILDFREVTNDFTKGDGTRCAAHVVVEMQQRQVFALVVVNHNLSQFLYRFCRQPVVANKEFLQRKHSCHNFSFLPNKRIREE